MTDVLIATEQIIEKSVVRVADRPIPFERFLDMAAGQWLELVDGVIVEKEPMVQLDHERCSKWFYRVAGMYVEKLSMGEMLSSRVMVQIDGFGGRMPDLLFVRQERLNIIQQKAVHGAPDFILKIVSPGDRPSGLRVLEADYARMGVPELVFINLRKGEIHLLRLNGAVYDQTIITAGPITFQSLGGLTLQAEWILNDPRPDEFDTLAALLTP